MLSKLQIGVIAYKAEQKYEKAKKLYTLQTISIIKNKQKLENQTLHMFVEELKGVLQNDKNI